MKVQKSATESGFMGSKIPRVPVGHLLEKSKLSSRPSEDAPPVRETLFPRSGEDNFSLPNFTIFTKHRTIKKIERWVVYSRGSRPLVLRTLFLKYLYETLTKEEELVFLLFEEIYDSIPIFFALRARSLGYKMKYIRRILEQVKFQSFKSPTYREFISLKNLEFKFRKEYGPPPKPQKGYSGYVKGYRSNRINFLQPDRGPIKNWSKEQEVLSFEDEIGFLLSFLEMIQSGNSRNFLLNHVTLF